MLGKKELEPKDINYGNVKNYLNELYYSIREIWNTADVTKEGSDLLADCLDGSPAIGITGVQILMRELDGETYRYSWLRSLIPGEFEYVKDKAKSPLKIYKEANKLVDFVNSVLERYKCSTNNFGRHK